MLFGVGILCCVSCSIVSYLLYAVAEQLPQLRKRELVFLLLFTCNFVVSVQRRFLFLLVLGCVILLWHSLDLPLIILVCTCKFSYKSFLDGRTLNNRFIILD